jgi:hypothetical protein
MEGSRFYPDPVCTHDLETSRLLGGSVRAGGSRERLVMSLQPAAALQLPHGFIDRIHAESV